MKERSSPITMGNRAARQGAPRLLRGSSHFVPVSWPSGSLVRHSDCKRKTQLSPISSSRSDMPPLKLARITSATETNSCPLSTASIIFTWNLYHLNAEEEPEDSDYPKESAFMQSFGPRGVLRCVALTSDNPAPADPRFGAWAKQK